MISLRRCMGLVFGGLCFLGVDVAVTLGLAFQAVASTLSCDFGG